MTLFDSYEYLPSGSTEVLGTSGKSARDGVKDEGKSSKKTPNTHFPSSSSTARARNHGQKDCKEFLSRKRIVNLKQLTSVVDDYDPLDLLSMLGFERPSDGSDISFAELLSTSPTPGAKPNTLSTHGPRKMEISSLLSVHAEENEDVVGHSNTQLSSSAPGHNVTGVSITGNANVNKSICSSSNTTSTNPVASQPMHIPPRLSYSPPSASSEDSIKDGMLCGSLGEKCGTFHHQLSSSSASSAFGGSGQMYYPNLLDDPQLIADKQPHATSHQIYPSYIVCKFYASPDTFVHISLVFFFLFTHQFYSFPGIYHGLREKRSRPEERTE